jgi:hypothetical protein
MVVGSMGMERGKGILKVLGSERLGLGLIR